MNDEGRAAGRAHGSDEVAHECVIVAPVDADPMLDGHIDRHRVTHRLDAVGHRCRLGHQAGSESALLDAL